MIALVDYRAGNLTSVFKALTHLRFDSQVTADPEIVRRADKIIVPGVGHFASTRHLQTSGLTDAIKEAVAAGIPLLGICLGMQWLFAGSEEAPDVASLAVFPGICSNFPAGVKSPHVGWNHLHLLRESRLCRAQLRDPFVYYSHSYRAGVTNDTVAISDYGSTFAAVVERDNVFGVQFHPEKSAAWGLQLLANFCGPAC